MQNVFEFKRGNVGAILTLKCQKVPGTHTHLGLQGGGWVGGGGETIIVGQPACFLVRVSWCCLFGEVCDCGENPGLAPPKSRFGVLPQLLSNRQCLVD